MINDYVRCTSKLRNEIRDLHTARARREAGTFLVEGPHACEELLAASATVQCVVIRDDAEQRSLDVARIFTERGVPVYAVGSRDMERMADTTTPRDILAVAQIPAPKAVGSRIIVLDVISDPGNLGTIIRTAAWFGYHDIILMEGSADPYAPKVVRASVGALLRVNVVRDVALDSLWELIGDVPLYAATTRGGEHPSALRGVSTCALVVGSEAHGVRPEIIKRCATLITIPGSDAVESLNAGIAGAILMYEAQ